MRRSIRRKIERLLKMIEQKRDAVARLEDRVDEARKRLLDKEISKAKYTKLKQKYSEKIRGFRGTINRYEKQRMNIIKREKEHEAEEDEEDEKERLLEEEERRMEIKEEREQRQKKRKKKKKKKKAVKKEKKKKKKKLSKEEKELKGFVEAYLKAYRSFLKSNLDKAERKGIGLYIKRPGIVTVVKGEGMATLVFSGPKSKDLKIQVVAEEDFRPDKLKDVVESAVVEMENLTEEKAAELGEAKAKSHAKM